VQWHCTGRVGEVYDPAGGLVTAVLSTKQRFLRTTTISYAELAAENSSVWYERINPLLKASSLHPNTTHSEALIRYTATPVWITDDRTLSVDGVLISG
jgi:hypothetical protein